MTFFRTSLRAATAVGAAAALALSGTAIASADEAPANSAREIKAVGSNVEVEFTLSEDSILDACGALLVNPVSGLGLLDSFATGDIEDLLTSLIDEPGVYVLTSDILSSPIVTLDRVTKSRSVSVEDVPDGPYLLATFCTGDDSENPAAPTPLLIGNPLDAIFSMSAGGGLDTLSSMLDGGEGGEGLLNLATLSSGEGDGELG